MNRGTRILCLWAALSSTVWAGDPQAHGLRVSGPTVAGAFDGTSIYSRWARAHFAKPISASTWQAGGALPASLTLSGLEVSSDTAAGRYRQQDPVVTRLTSGRQLLFWVDEKQGPGRITARVFDAGLLPLAPEFELFGDGQEREPGTLSAAGDGSTAALSWLNGNPYAVHTALCDSFGSVQIEQAANEIASAPFLSSPALARLYPRQFLTVWEEYRLGWRIVGQAFDSAGTRQGGNRLLDGTADTLLKTSPAIAGDTSGGYLLAWSQGDLARSDIYVRLFDAADSAKGSAFAITLPVLNESYMLPAVVYSESADQFQVWYVRADNPADSTSLWLRTIGRDGSLMDSARVLPAGPYPWSPSAASSGIGTMMFTERFDNLSEVRSLLVNSAGAVLDSSEVISAAPTRERTGVSCSSGADTVTVVWQDRVSGEYDIHGLARAGAQTVSTEATFSVEGPGGQQTDAAVAGRFGGGVHVAYSDQQAGGDIAMADVDEGGAILLRRKVSDDSLQAPQYDPQLASTNSGWCLITWTDERTDWPGPAVHAAGRFAQAGLFPKPAFPLSTSTAAGYQGQTDVTMRKDKTSAVVWVDDRSGTPRAYLRRYDDTGGAQGAEVSLENGSLPQLLIALEQDPVVSVDSGGTLWTVWSALDVITDSFYVLAQAWSMSGVRKGGNLLLSPLGPTPIPQAFDAAASGDGHVRLVWYDASGASPAVMTAVFDTTGTVLEGPVLVSAAPISATDPRLAVDVTGRWAAGWSQVNGTEEDVVWHRFDASGTPTAPIERISGPNPASRRRAPALVFAGTYLYGAWHDNEQQGQGYDVRLSSLLKASADVDEGSLRPLSFSLSPNVPNPFNGSTRIEYVLSEPAQVQLNVYDALGRHVKNLWSGWQAPGLHQLLWDGTDDSGGALASGVYFYRLLAGGHADTRKMLYLK